MSPLLISQLSLALTDKPSEQDPNPPVDHLLIDDLDFLILDDSGDKLLLGTDPP